jgi:hypothetical protein
MRALLLLCLFACTVLANWDGITTSGTSFEQGTIFSANNNLKPLYDDFDTPVVEGSVTGQGSYFVLNDSLSPLYDDFDTPVIEGFVFSQGSYLVLNDSLRPLYNDFDTPVIEAGNGSFSLLGGFLPGLSIAVSAPSNGATYNESTVDLNFTVSAAANTTQCWYYVNSTEYSLGNVTTGVLSSTQMSLADGAYSLYVACNEENLYNGSAPTVYFNVESQMSVGNCRTSLNASGFSTLLEDVGNPGQDLGNDVEKTTNVTFTVNAFEINANFSGFIVNHANWTGSCPSFETGINKTGLDLSGPVSYELWVGSEEFLDPDDYTATVVMPGRGYTQVWYCNGTSKDSPDCTEISTCGSAPCYEEIGNSTIARLPHFTGIFSTGVLAGGGAGYGVFSAPELDLLIVVLIFGACLLLFAARR